MSVLEALNWRYAVKKFSNKKLSDSQINGLIESVRLAPSAYGVQPYQLIVVTKDEFKQACLPHSYGQDKVVNCSHLLVFAHKTELKKTDIDNFIMQLANNQDKPVDALSEYQKQIESDLLSRSKAQQSEWAQQQSYIALGTLLTYAAASQIDACPMTGFDSVGLSAALGLTAQGLSAAILCPVGIRAEEDHAAKRPKSRLSTEQLVVNL